MIIHNTWAPAEIFAGGGASSIKASIGTKKPSHKEKDPS